jgi:hypothetical protein
MRDNLSVGVFAVLFTFLVVGLASWAQPRVKVVPRVTCPILDCDPDFFKDSEVAVKTDGMQPGDAPNELVYRKRADHPPVVVCRFKGPVPEKLPAYLVGLCLGRRGLAVLLVDCRP